MRPSLLLIWVTTAIAASGSLALTAPGMSRARAESRRELARMQASAEVARHIVAARAAMPSAAGESADSSALATRVSTVLSSCGLPLSVLSSLTPDAAPTSSAQQAGNAAAMRRRAALTLNGLTLPQLGRFLEQWRRAEPAWVPATIDLAPDHQRAAVAGGDLPIRAVISLERLVFQGEAR